MFTDLPPAPEQLIQWSWSQIEPYYQDLAARPLTADTVTDWLTDWSRLSECAVELELRLVIATTVNTVDQEAERRYNAFLDEIAPSLKVAEQGLKEKLLASDLKPAGFDLPLRNMRAQADLFREANVPLLTQEAKLCTEYDKIRGAQMVIWEGQELTLAQLSPVYQETDRDRRERAWRLVAQRQLADREAINDLWQRFLPLRRQIAANAGVSDYCAYKWQQLQRFDYTPADCITFAQAIQDAVVPAASRIYERRCQRLGLAALRPWDLDVDPLGRPPLHPFDTTDEFVTRTAAVFHHVDPQLGAYFDRLVREDLLDLESRKNKAHGGYCEFLAASRQPFIFMNAAGVHVDVLTLLHEGGHAFHSLEACRLPYFAQWDSGMEFLEVASMAMELLAAPYLDAADGFYTPAQAARARIENLEKTILFWPYMAVVDQFQHWVYQNPDDALDPAQCDAQWAALWARFMPGVDWSGLEQEMMTTWQRQLHIHQVPFYYVEYGLAQLGAVQVWRNALRDQARAVAAYRRALALGGTATIPELYETAGARFAFDAGTLREAVDLMEETIAALESQNE
ncbi:MAG: M3 family oligoendopeptidase [Chloroflexi bacterium]|nr:M3 family oligoendopeptidase [Chloroflexota bacterium]